MKRRQRRPVLTLNKPHGNYHGEHAQNRCKPASNLQSAQNESNNPLANLLCQYNSDSDTEDSKKDTQKLDDQVNDFLKEIQLIAPQPASNAANDANSASKTSSQSGHHTGQHTLWQECYDQATGYPYYWHVETNDVQWDMPEELRLLRKQSEVGSGAKPAVQGSHWVDFSSIAYRQSQANIPEGMIPQEVVARNRNRFLHKENPKKSNSESKPEIKNESPAKDEDSDDGRIEMITSFGSDGSDSEDEMNSSDEKKMPKQSLPESTNSTSVSYLKSAEIGPAFCPRELQSPTRSLPRPYKPDLSASSLANQPEQCEQRKIIESDNKLCMGQGEKEFSLIENKNRKETNVQNTSVPKLDFKVSLVPGYGDDSDGEEEVRLPKQEVKPLFPISQDEEYTSITKSSLNVHDAVTRDSSRDCNVQSGDQGNDSGGCDAQDVKNDQEKAEKESKTDEEKAKTNIFLEDMQVCGKAFQRKKRIAFDVTSTKIKRNNVCHDNAVQDDNNSDSANNETTSRNSEGGDYQPSAESEKEADKASVEETEQCASVKPEEKKPDSKDESCEQEVSAEPKTVSIAAEEKTNGELNELSQIIGEKLKFLSEGREGVSAVQTMQIQLQTLSTAWTAGSLEESYFQKWLTSTNHELERLEQDAAPAGWLCQWDRSHKRYYYHNTSTGTSQWTYPDTGIAGGTEEMELCTTPPPPESEELSVTGSPGTKKAKEKQPEDADDIKIDDASTGDRRPTDIEAPPPPQISNPSPPPPPRIFAEDLKKDRKKREKPDDKSFDVKRRRLGKERIASLETTQVINPTLESLAYAHPQTAVSPQTSIHASMEPLPPGVDLPDTSYEAATLKGIIYNAASQQSNAALYAPSIGDPTIPILSHQAGLLQEPFVHYPAFHQHLHNTIAVANKHGGQGAIQFMMGYAPIYTNNKIIAKPPMKASKESLGSALNSFYNDIARIERTETEQRTGQHQDSIAAVAATTSATATATPAVVEQSSIPTEETKPEAEGETASSTETIKEKKKKKVARIGISKKHKEMSTMVAKWQRVQKNLEDTV